MPFNQSSGFESHPSHCVVMLDSIGLKLDEKVERPNPYTFLMVAAQKVESSSLEA